MTVNRGPGVAPIAGVGTTTVEHRLQLAGLYAENSPGVPRSGVLSQATDLLVTARADMSYDVGPAALVISRTAAEGVYTPTLTGTTNVVTGAAPGTNSRWDLIYVKQNDQAKGDADNDAVIGVQQGTAAASPTKPTGSLPAGAYVIAEARIFALTTGTNGGSNTIAQTWRHTAARGARLTIRSATERDEITTPAKGMEILRTDLTQSDAAGTIERWNGTRWDHFGHVEWSTGGSGLTSGNPFNLGIFTQVSGKTTAATAFVTSVAGGGLQFTDAGDYQVDVAQKWSASVGSGRAFISIEDVVGTSSNIAYGRVPFGNGEDTASVSINLTVTAGQIIYPKVFQTSGGNLNVSGVVRVKRLS